MENVNNSFFDGYYKDIWKSIIPAELTARETDFMLQYFDLRKGDKVLDLLCGYGRHALALARNGIEVTAVDNLGAYINELEETVNKEALPVKVVKEDVMAFNSHEQHRLALCMGNSLNFFNREDTCRLLASIRRQLQPGGWLLINSWSLAETVVKQFAEKAWSVVDNLKVLSDSRYLFHPTRIETENTIIAPDGRMEVKQAVDYIFSVAEMESMLNESGFILKEIYSIPGRKLFTVGEPRAYIIAYKNK